jgi:predicted enzyme related to lactoylglutathione lyase
MRKLIGLVLIGVLLSSAALAQEEAAAEEHPHGDSDAAHAEEFMPALGSITFLELPALDPAAAGEFYSSLFGWQVNMDEASEMLFFTDPHGAMGTFVQAEEPTTGESYVFYLAVDSVSAKLAEIEDAGGTVLMAEEALPEDWGLIGLFADPTGNVIGLWSPGMTGGEM